MQIDLVDNLLQTFNATLSILDTGDKQLADRFDFFTSITHKHNIEDARKFRCGVFYSFWPTPGIFHINFTSR